MKERPRLSTLAIRANIRYSQPNGQTFFSADLRNCLLFVDAVLGAGRGEGEEGQEAQAAGRQ
jgi:hypothetical protein